VFTLPGYSYESFFCDQIALECYYLRGTDVICRLRRPGFKFYFGSCWLYVWHTHYDLWSWVLPQGRRVYSFIVITIWKNSISVREREQQSGTIQFLSLHPARDSISYHISTFLFQDIIAHKTELGVRVSSGGSTYSSRFAFFTSHVCPLRDLR